MSRIDNPEQLLQLRLHYAAVEGALGVARAAQQTADTAIAQYLTMLGTLIGVELRPGDSARVDWHTGEVLLEHAREPALNGVVPVEVPR